MTSKIPLSKKDKKDKNNAQSQQKNEFSSKDQNVHLRPGLRSSKNSNFFFALVAIFRNSLCHVN